jgi:hypothetical protein
MEYHQKRSVSIPKYKFFERKIPETADLSFTPLIIAKETPGNGRFILPVMKNGKACFFDFSITEPLLGPVLIP